MVTGYNTDTIWRPNGLTNKFVFVVFVIIFDESEQDDSVFRNQLLASNLDASTIKKKKYLNLKIVSCVKLKLKCFNP